MITEIKASTISATDHLTAIRLRVSLWTGTKRMTADDFKGEKDSPTPPETLATILPPETLATLGSKKVFNPKLLFIFNRLKYEATSLLKRHGMEYLFGYLVPDSVVDTVEAGLHQCMQSFIAEKKQLIDNYDTNLKLWIDENASWAHAIEPYVEDKVYVSSRLSFKWDKIKLVLPGGENSDTTAEDMNQELSGVLFSEIAKVAQDADKKSYIGKTAVTRKALSPIKSIQAKLKGLVFVDPLVSPVISMIDDALVSLPKRGSIDGHHLSMLKGLISRLSNPDVLKMDAVAILTGKPINLIDDDPDDTDQESSDETDNAAGPDTSQQAPSSQAAPAAESAVPTLPHENVDGTAASEPAADTSTAALPAAPPVFAEPAPTFSVDATSPTPRTVPAEQPVTPQTHQADSGQRQNAAASPAPAPTVRKVRVSGQTVGMF